jgi:hypothetical protein
VNCQTKESQVSGLEVLHSAALSRAPVGLVESFLCLSYSVVGKQKRPDACCQASDLYSLVWARLWGCPCCRHYSTILTVVYVLGALGAITGETQRLYVFNRIRAALH